MDNRKDKPVVLYDGKEGDNDVSGDMMANFELMRIYNGQR